MQFQHRTNKLLWACLVPEYETAFHIRALVDMNFLPEPSSVWQTESDFHDDFIWVPIDCDGDILRYASRDFLIPLLYWHSQDAPVFQGYFVHLARYGTDHHAIQPYYSNRPFDRSNSNWELRSMRLYKEITDK